MSSSQHITTPTIITAHQVADDPARQHRINANSFQQDAILSYQGWQYACFYADKTQGDSSELLVHIIRRTTAAIASGRAQWETLALPDYSQAVDDGHNTISLGICHGNGTIHVSFDHHCDELRFRLSRPGVAHRPADHPWTPELFGRVQHHLPGQDFPDNIFSEVTYPRFLSVQDDLLLSYRIGQAGSGSEILFRYSSRTGQYEYLGQLLTGVGNSPYINALSYAGGRIHASGCFRKFIEYEGAGDPSSTAHKANAGPNGPENNCHLFYAFSDDAGDTWKSSDGRLLASLKDGGTILPDAPGLVVFDIPVNNGILNQEGQAADASGGFHALNRENEVWIHYYRDPQGRWSRKRLPGPRPTRTGNRGSVAASKDAVYLALPGNLDSSLTIVGGSAADLATLSPLNIQNLLWQAVGFDGEPHLDIAESAEATVLSVFTRTAGSRRKVVILDLLV